MLLLSKFPISMETEIRTYEDFLWWKVPDDATTDSLFPLLEGEPGHLTTRLFARAFADVPLTVSLPEFPDTTVDIHFLITHAAKPGFKDAMNTRRNHDEIRALADYVHSEPFANIMTYLPDRLGDDKKFVILGNLNADRELDGYEWQEHNAILRLLSRPRVVDPFSPDEPAGCAGALAKAICDGDDNTNQQHDTVDYPGLPGGLRVDYVLPSTDFVILDKRVVWPDEDAENFGLVEGSWDCEAEPSPSGELGPHHLVGVRIAVWVE